MILELHRQGVGVSAIARRVDLDRKTVRRYIAQGLEPPAYGPRQPRVSLLRAFEPYLRERLAAFPQLTGRRLHRELRELGYSGGYTILTDLLREIRPGEVSPFEIRFETPPGRQAQVDFAHFRTVFTDEPGVERIIWLFSLVLGHSRMLWGRFVLHQDLQTLLRCHAAAFEALGGVPGQILYDRCARCSIARIPTPATSSTIARCWHSPATTATCRRRARRIVPRRRARSSARSATSARTSSSAAAFATSTISTRSLANGSIRSPMCASMPRPGGLSPSISPRSARLQPLTAGAFQAVLRLERRITRDGMVSIDGNLYSVPNSARRRTVEVHSTANEVRILEDGAVIAVHPVLDGRGQRRIIAGHRKSPPPNGQTPRDDRTGAACASDVVALRPLAFYDAVGKRLAANDAAA
jgi:transposase